MRKVLALIVLLVITISCNGIFQQEKTTEITYHLQNISSNDIKLIRYKISNSIDTVFLSENKLFVEVGSSSVIGGEGFNYPSRFDSISVVYNDTISLMHYAYDVPFYFLEKPIFDRYKWETIKEAKPKNWLTEITIKYDFTDQDFEEAKLKGKKVQ